MQRILISTTVAILLVMTMMAITHDSSAGTEQTSRGNLVHMVSFKFKESATNEDVHKVEAAFAALQDSIPQIVSYEWGTNNSPEGLNKGCTHGFVLTFYSAQDRDDYLIHPQHKAFGGLVGPLLEDVLVVDFWNQTRR